jgi:Arc/MetJ family transcription regulator
MRTWICSVPTAVPCGVRHGGLQRRPRHLNQHQLMLHWVHIQGEESMRTTINIDDELLAKATKLTGPMDRTAMVSEGLKALIERESARRLARLGGTQSKLKAARDKRLRAVAAALGCAFQPLIEVSNP